MKIKCPLRIEVNPDQIMDILAGRRESLDLHGIDLSFPALIHCEDIPVCVIAAGRDGWNVEWVACDHPVHGVHPRYAGMYAAMQEKLKKLTKYSSEAAKKLEHLGIDTNSGVVSDDGMTEPACPKCGGTGLLKPNSTEARMLVIMAGVFGMFRGIPIPQTENKLNHGDMRASLDTVLSAWDSEKPNNIPQSAAGGHTGGAVYQDDEEAEYDSDKVSE